ncbi:MAG: inorganic pyrophosphatase [Rickettsiaceae bacterium]|jgi:inorganic pyrophosphatase|nr:inorganic pyrophosphatase [Rickettsiaceae bacterium]
MDISKISPGKNLPEQINVIIEVPMNSDPVKYEMDKESGAIFVDRFLATPMFYPCNYGFIPGTLSDDGDPADVLVVSDYPVIPGSVIAAKPVGVLIMEDEKGMDEKILAVPAKKLNSQFENVENYTDLPASLIGKISHFFERYKDLEKGKWVKIKGFEDASKAKELILEAYQRAEK